jgi:L-lysine exporter family protein LysE/ArgO
MIAIVPGFLAGLSLIIAIGAQNAFVIRQGLTKKYVLLTVLICACSDALLIALGASGLGALIKSNKDLLEFVRWFGVAYLLWFAFKSAKSAFKQEVLNSAGEASANKRSVVLTVLALTFLNPHVYLDTVILLGSISNLCYRRNNCKFSMVHIYWVWGQVSLAVYVTPNFLENT